MRDIAVTFIVMIGCFYTLKKPYIGILLWSWLSYMNPHRLAYGFAYNMPFAQVTAIVLLVSMLINKQRQSFPINIVTVTWIIFIFLMGITTIFAYYPEMALSQFIKVIKIQLIVFLTMLLITDIEKLKNLIWIVVISIGFYSVKGGIFTLITGGGYRVWGPNNTYIEENNALAIAILMVIPLMIFSRQVTKKLWVKRGLLFAIVTSLFTVLGSQSRGALLAIIAVGGLYWLKSKAKLASGMVITITGIVLLAFMPKSWYERMDTIQTYEEDTSAMGRLNAWKYAYNAANHNPLGMGFESWSSTTFSMYAPNPADVHAAHSIYFSVLADHGWLGLILFLTIFYLTWRKLSGIIRKTHNNESLKEFELLAKMLQIGFIAYLTGGAFLSLSYFDLPWHFISFVVLLDKFIQNSPSKQDVTTISAATQAMRRQNTPNI